MELRWTDEGRDCTACFNSEAEARQCAALVGTREGVEPAPEQARGIVEYFR